MVSSAKKAGPNLKPMALHQTMVSLGNRCRKILSYCKQMWYVPFIWSLTWYSYWIFREFVILNTPLIQVNPMNYLGAVISISVLLLAMPRLGTSIRKKSVLLGTRVGINIKKAFFNVRVRIKNNSRSTSFSNVKNSVQDIQVEKPMPQKLQIKYQSPIGKSERKGSEQATQELIKPQSGARALSSSVDYSNQHRMPQEIPSECLTCAKLMSCNHRRDRSVESQVQGHKSIKCPFAEELSSNKTAEAS